MSLTSKLKSAFAVAALAVSMTACDGPYERPKGAAVHNMPERLYGMDYFTHAIPTAGVVTDIEFKDDADYEYATSKCMTRVRGPFKYKIVRDGEVSGVSIYQPHRPKRLDIGSKDVDIRYAYVFFTHKDC